MKELLKEVRLNAIKLLQHGRSTCEVSKHEGVAIFVWGCMTSSCGMGHMSRIEGKVTQALYLSILQDGVMKTLF
jgi:hypothetical protein